VSDGDNEKTNNNNDRIHLAQDRVEHRVLVNLVMKLWVL
jgi:hypothetical protein